MSGEHHQELGTALGTRPWGFTRKLSFPQMGFLGTGKSGASLARGMPIQEARRNHYHVPPCGSEEPVTA
jgi:hypothetical protein